MPDSLKNLTDAYAKGLNSWTAKSRDVLGVREPGRPSGKSMFEGVLGLAGPPDPPAPMEDKPDIPGFFSDDMYKIKDTPV
jgi:hypothetical protein